MKKTTLLLWLLFASVLQARFFLGIEGGCTSEGIPALQAKGKGIEFHTISTSNLGDILKKGASGYSIGATLGSESFFGKYFGLRWQLGVGYSSAELELEYNKEEKEIELKSIGVDVGVDMIVNVVNSGNFALGFFGGAGVDYQYFTSTNNPKIHSVGFFGKGGITTLLFDHHRMEFFAKIPFADMSAKFELGDKNTIASNAQKLTFGASYKFVF